jgi:FixJ family two-component response regulator
MPGMSGAELADVLRRRRPTLPIVIATGYAELPEGASATLIRLAKPFTQSEVELAMSVAMRDQVATSAAT